MSDPANPQPIPLKWRGCEYALGVLTHLEEGLFVGEHLAFAQGLVEATRGKVGDPAYQRALNAHLYMAHAGEFSYGGSLMMSWLWSPEGRAAYFELLMRKGEGEHKGASPPPRHALVRAVRDKDADLALAWDRLLERDFFSYLQALKVQAGGTGTSSASAPAGTTSPTPAG